MTPSFLDDISFIFTAFPIHNVLVMTHKHVRTFLCIKQLILISLQNTDFVLEIFKLYIYKQTFSELYF
jgi:hypothetical protein